MWLNDFLVSSWLFLCQTFWLGGNFQTGTIQPTFHLDNSINPSSVQDLHPRLKGTCKDSNFTKTIGTGTGVCRKTSQGDPFSCCNNETSRSVWCSGWNICSDYENTQKIGSQPLPAGIPRDKEYTLEVKYGPASPDGYLKKNAMLFNGTYPGPLLEAIWGQNLKLQIINQLGMEPGPTQNMSNGTSIHAHGLRLWNNVDQDGVPGVTQCPIAPGKSLTYNWPMTQYATTWYHSHLSLQYPNGLVGPLVVYGPKSANWDIDLGPVLLTDWFHANPFEKYHDELVGMVSPDSTLINGKGKFNCSDIPDPENCIHEGSYWDTVFQPGQNHILRLVNTATQSTFRFSIDGHNMTLVTADFTPIRPVVVDYLDLAVGQRYEVLVKANYSSGDFWMRADPLHCNKAQIGKSGIRPENVAMGIIRYDKASNKDPSSVSHIPDDEGTACVDIDSSYIVPMYVRTPGYFEAKKYYNAMHNNFQVSLVEYPQNVSMGTSKASGSEHEMHLWKIADYSLKINWSDPALLMQMNNPSWKAKDFPGIYAVVDAQRRGVGDTNVIFHINGTVDKDTSKKLLGNRNVAHPIHIHGHDFIILQQGSGNLNPDTLPDKLYNPARRDVAVMPGDGYLLLSFPVDNAGIWLLHCHIAWHASQGLALLILENLDSDSTSVSDDADDWNWLNRKDNVGALINQQTCKEWNDYLSTWKPLPDEMEDSGV